MTPRDVTDMPHTFEERIAPELDALYRGALFLTGGRVQAAGDLLVWTLNRAFHAHRGEGLGAGPLRPVLVGHMADEYEASAARLTDYGPPDAEEAVFRAADHVDPSDRSAVWLVLLERWSYEDAQRRLRLDREALVARLSGRRALSRAWSPGGRSSGGGSL